MTWILVAVVALVVYILVRDKKIKLSGNSEAEETLKRRYVNGEIDEETYLKMKRTINQ